MSEEASLIPPKPTQVNGFRRVGEIVHVVSDDGICAAGIVCMTHEGNADIVRITLCVPVPNAPAMCIGDVRRDDTHEARTWHDMTRCKNEQVGQKRRVLVS